MEMAEYLEPFEENHPSNTFVIFHQPDGKKYICKQYEKLNNLLAESLALTINNYNFFVDLTSLYYHSLIFDVDVKGAETETIDILLRYFDSHFKKVLKKYIGLPIFVVILAMRRDNSGGLHVHVPGFAISHDDYIHLCNLMTPECYYKENNIVIQLDIPSSMCLVASGKPQTAGDSVYRPVRIIKFKTYFEEIPREEERILILNHFNREEQRYFVLNHFNLQTECPFENIENLAFLEVASLMTPIPKNKWKILYYTTTIVPEKKFIKEFISLVNNTTYRVDKNDNLQIDYGERNGSYLHRFLKNHSDSIEVCDFSNNRVAKTWYKRYSSKFENDVGFFKHINIKIRRHCIHLREESNPLKTILHRDEFVLPVFYAICSIMRKKDFTSIFQAFIELHEPAKNMIKVLNHVPRFHLTFKTILHCAFQTVPLKTKEGIFWEHIGMGWDWIFESTTSVRQMQDHLKFIQETHFPIVKGIEKFYVWDPALSQWNHLENFKDKIQEIYRCMTYFKGFSKIPNEVRMQLDNETDWITQIVEDRITVLSESVVQSAIMHLKRFDEFSKWYGKNVPEYLFLDLNLEAHDETS